MKIPVPLKDQRTEKTFDGHPPEDGNMDCVPTSLAAICQGLLGGSYSGDDLHDRVYGQGYKGMQDPARFAGLLGGFGIAMTRVNGSPPRSSAAHALRSPPAVPCCSPSPATGAMSRRTRNSLTWSPAATSPTPTM